MTVEKRHPKEAYKLRLGAAPDGMYKCEYGVLYVKVGTMLAYYKAPDDFGVMDRKTLDSNSNTLVRKVEGRTVTIHFES